MALSNTPTMSEAAESLMANCSYYATGSVSSAIEYVKAIEFILNMPERGVKGQEEYEFNHTELAKKQSAARQWVESRGGTSSTAGYHFATNYRG